MTTPRCDDGDNLHSHAAEDQPFLSFIMSPKDESVFDFWELMLVGFVLAAIAFSLSYGLD